MNRHARHPSPHPLHDDHAQRHADDPAAERGQEEADHGEAIVMVSVAHGQSAFSATRIVGQGVFAGI